MNLKDSLRCTGSCGVKKKVKLETIEITVNVDTDKFDLQSVADYFQMVLDTLEEVGTIETWGIIA